MKGSIACLSIFLLVLPVSTYGDTITMKIGMEVNGRITYEETTFTVVAKFAGGQRTLTIKRENVVKVEINMTDYNSGTPGDWMVDYEKLPNPPKSQFPGGRHLEMPVAADPDTVILLDNTKEKGKLVRISSHAIELGKDDGTRKKLKRLDVHSVVLGE